MRETETDISTPKRLTWRVAEVAKIVNETPRVKSLVLDVPDWPGHRAGQHVDVRLTAEDGYQAQRSYSIASEPENARLMLFEDIIYREELDQMAARNDGLTVVYTLTRRQPPGWTGGARRIDRSMLESIVELANARPKIFICGPTSLVESVAQSLLELGHERHLIKTERFGPTGA